jgi:hypothetical protein
VAREAGAEPATIPRFFGGIGSVRDRDEQAATSIGRQVGAVAGLLGSGGTRLGQVNGAGGVGDRVDDLPVSGHNGLGGIVEVARRSAWEAVASLSLLPSAGGATGVADPAHPLLAGLGAGGSRTVRGVLGRPGEEVGPDQADGLDGAEGAEATDAGVQGVIGPSPSAAGDSYSRLSELLELLEERVLTEIERRGGRFAGVF